jgi:polar amino acid transport system substrate-binding protein
MKKAILLMSLMFFLLPLNGMGRMIKMGAAEWSPFMVKKVEGQGLLVEISEKALKAVGYDFEVNFYPWARAVKNVQDGIIDALTSVSFTKKRELHMLYAKTPIFETKMMLYHSTNNPKIKPFTGLDKLCASGKNYKVGTINELYIIPMLKKYKCINIKTHSELVTMPKKISLGRLDYYVDNQRSVLNMKNDPGKFGLKPDQISSIATGKIVLDTDKLYTVFSKKVKDAAKIAQDFDRGLKLIIANGTYDSLFKKYGVAIVK